MNEILTEFQICSKQEAHESEEAMSRRAHVHASIATPNIHLDHNTRTIRADIS
jgi:hypothetical protein